MSEVKYMRLADGTLIDTATGRPVVSTEINNAFSDSPKTSMLTQVKKSEQAAFSGAQRRYIDDLPASPQQMKAIAVICGLHVFGLSIADIAYVAGTDYEIVEQIMETAAFHKFLDGQLQQLREHDTDKIRKRINDEAVDSVETITKLKKSPDDKVKLAAAKDLLDRHERGYGNQGENLAQKSALTIRIIDDRDNPMDKLKVDIDG